MSQFIKEIGKHKHGWNEHDFENGLIETKQQLGQKYLNSKTFKYLR